MWILQTVEACVHLFVETHFFMDKKLVMMGTWWLETDAQIPARLRLAGSAQEPLRLNHTLATILYRLEPLVSA